MAGAADEPKSKPKRDRVAAPGWESLESPFDVQGLKGPPQACCGPYEWRYKGGYKQEHRKRAKKGTSTRRIPGVTIGLLAAAALAKDSPPEYSSNDLELINKTWIFTDNDGVELVHFAKGGLGLAFWDRGGATVGRRGLLATEMLRLSDFGPKPKEAASDSRNYYPSNSTVNPRGIYHCALWHASGHENARANATAADCGALPSSDLLGNNSAKRYKHMSRYLMGMAPVKQAACGFFEAAQPDNY